MPLPEYTAAVHNSFEKTADWPAIMAKAKRLIQSGQVQVLRNGYNYIIGHVIGDHGDYETEISRDDPNSRAITGWQCSCPWDQYAWQRTRKWKKFEGRPCAHTMALYWAALATPLDEQLTEEQAMQMGTGQQLTPKAPAVEHKPHPDLPRSFGPEGDVLQGDQLQMGEPPPDATGGPPGPAQAPLAPPPGAMGPEPSGVLPPFAPPPEAPPYQGPGTTPGGGVSPPGAMSVPGAKPKSPFNPLQNDGTLSKVAGETLNQEKRRWQELYPASGTAPVAELPGGYTIRDNQSSEAASRVGQMMRNCWQDVWPELMQEGPYTDPKPALPGAQWMSLHDQHGIPRAAFYQHDNVLHEPRGMRNQFIHPQYAAPLADWASQNGMMISHRGGARHATDPDSWLDDNNTFYGDLYHAPVLQSEANPELHEARTSADFNPPEIVRLKKPMYGIAEGPVQGQYGDGGYREVPEGSTGEVLSQDASTGWVEIIVPLDDSGPHEPFHVRCFVEPGDIDHTSQAPPGPFIRRRSKVAGPMDDFIDRLDEIPGTKHIAPIPNEELTYQPGDRVTMEYANPAPRSTYGLSGEGTICPNTGTVVNARQPGTYDVQWDMGASPDFSSYYEPGQIGEAIEQHRLWPEGHENVYKSVIDPHAPAAIPEYWPEQYEA